MEPSKMCFDLIKHQEGLIPAKEDGLYHAYHGKKDRAGVWTIGYGMTWYPKGKAVREGDTLTLDEVNNMFEWHVNRFGDIVDAHLPKGLPVKQCQFDAFVDFTFNLGEAALLTSTLWKKFCTNPSDSTIWNYNSLQGLPVIKSCEFLKWVYSAGNVVGDLVFRRATDSILYSTGTLNFLGH